MATHDYVIDNQTAPNFRADINNALQAIVTQNSSGVAPSVTYANMIWYDTGTNQLKKRNEANSAWIILGTIDESLSTFTPSGERALSSQAQAEAGIDNATLMTPLRVAQAISAQSAIDIQTFTASGTWTKPSNISSTAVVYVRMWGGGGAGGGSFGRGGGGGSYGEFWLPASSFNATEAVTVGAGGSAGASGGSSSVLSKSVAGGIAGASGGTGGGSFFQSGPAGTNAAQAVASAGGAGGSGVVGPGGSASLWGGGGGGNDQGDGGNAIFGGGGGAGGEGSSVRGLSLFGGNGGNAGSNGQVPGGGGGAGGSPGSGARGQVEIYVFE